MSNEIPMSDDEADLLALIAVTDPQPEPNGSGPPIEPGEPEDPLETNDPNPAIEVGVFNDCDNCGAPHSDKDEILCPACKEKIPMDPKPEPPHATREQGLAAFDALKHFIGPEQREVLKFNMEGEEGQFFYDKMAELAGIVENMPGPYGTRNFGNKAIVHLHYFAGGEAHFYITEKDTGDEDDPPELKGVQQQAYGLARLFLSDDGELGYISIEEILQNHGELDLYWTPNTLEQIQEEHHRSRRPVEKQLQHSELN